MAKEKPLNNEEILNKLKANLEEKEKKLNSVKSLELNGKNTLKKGQTIKEYGKEVGYIVKNIQTNQEGRQVVKLELADGKIEEYELEDQKVRDEGKNIETVWRKIGTTEGLRIGFPNNEYVDKSKEVVKEELEEDVPQIIVMPNKKEQPIKMKETKENKIKLPTLKTDNEVFIPFIGNKFYMIKKGKKEEYTITKSRTVKGTEKQLFKAKINPENSSEDAIEMSAEEISKLMDKGRIFLDKKEEVKKKVVKKNIEPVIARTKKDEETLNEMAQSADKNREELMNKDKEPKTLDELKSHHEIGKKIDEVMLKSLDDIEEKKIEKNLPENLSRDTKEFLKMERRKAYTQEKIDLETRRHEEFANPDITQADALAANPDFIALYKKDPKKFCQSGLGFFGHGRVRTSR